MPQKKYIPSFQEWRALPLKEDRKTILGKLREQVGDKELLKAWDLSPNSYYTTLMSYGFPTKGIMESLGSSHPRPPKKQKESEEPRVKRKYTKKDKPEKIRESIPSDRLWPRNEVIEVEHSVIPEPIQESALTWRGGHNIERPLQLPFPHLRGTPSQLLKQFEALVLFLSALEDDSVRYEVHLSASKQSGS